MKGALPKNLYEHLSTLAEKYSDKIALVGIDEKGETRESISYRQLLGHVEAAAGELLKLGLVKGDRIALAFRNSPALLIWSWAAWASGIVTVPMDTKRDTPELYEYKINLNKAKVLIIEPGIQVPELSDVRIHTHTAFGEVSGEAVTWENGLSHLALILFTSGTTSHPKGAKLSLENLLVNADGIREWLRITETDTFLVNLPLHHINSTTFCLSTLLAGGTIAIPPNYSNSNFWQQVAATGATITSIVQSILFDQIVREKEFAAHKNSIKLQRIQIGSAPVVAHTVQEFLKRFGIAVYQGYGQTETALRVTGVPMGLSKERYDALVEENSIGTAMPWADLQIADENGKLLQEGEEGELVVKGAAVMEGYIGNEEAFRNGYFLTGDVGCFRIIDGERYFYLKGRKREIIIKGGINISPIAVENQLKKMSDDIGQVYVIGVADERYGEEVTAVIVWNEGVDQYSAMRALKSRLVFGTPHLSRYETPGFLASIASSELPMTSTGKVQRTVLKTALSHDSLEPVTELLKTPKHTFAMLDPQSRYFFLSHELYNHCWQPLILDEKEYKKMIAKQCVLLALDKRGDLLGQIAVIRTDLSGEELLHTPYAQLSSSAVVHETGKALVCVSICSADFHPKEIPSVDRVPTLEEVQKYVPLDPVFKFHQRAKGGLTTGASLVGLIPNGRPEDQSSLGYNMLLKYPAPGENPAITPEAPISNQLLEVILMIAKDLGVEDVYAYSRPGGLAVFVSEGKKE